MVSEEIKKIMKKLGWTQKELAQKAGIHPITLNRNLKQNKFSDKTIRKIVRVCHRENPYIDYRVLYKPDAPVMKISGRIELVGESVEIKNDRDIERIFKDILKIKQISSSLEIADKYVIFEEHDFRCPRLYPFFNSLFKEKGQWWIKDITEAEFFKELKNIFNSDFVFRQVILNTRFYGKEFFLQILPRV